jgi:hypothetical protein
MLVTTLLALAIPVSGTATQKHHHYKVIDMGTFGGPASNFSYNPSQDINHRGVVAGYAETATPDPLPHFPLTPTASLPTHFNGRTAY